MSPCLQLCDVNTFGFIMAVSHEEKTFVAVNIPGGILHESMFYIAVVGWRLV